MAWLVAIAVSFGLRSHALAQADRAPPAVPRATAAIGSDVIAAMKLWAAGDLAGRRTLEALSRSGRADAQEAMGEMLGLRGLIGTPDDVAACRYFEQASSTRGDALHSFAHCVEEGVGRAPDPARAAQLYRRAADQGFRKAMCALGNLYIAGKGVPVDAERGAGLCLKGAESGDMDAQTDLGNLYVQGVGVAHDMAKARFWYAKAAAQGQRNAEFTLGIIYWNGDGVGKDQAKAAELWRSAYRHGRLYAAHLLGDWALATWLAAHAPGDTTLLDEAIGWEEAALRAPGDEKARKAATERLDLARAAKAAAAKLEK